MAETPNQPSSPPTAEPSPKPSAGQIALSVMGYLEIVVSVVLLLLEVPVAAVAFAVAALFLTFISMQVRKQRLEYMRRTGRLPQRAGGDEAQRRKPGAAFWVQLIIGAGLIIASIVFVFLQNYLLAVNLALWGITVALFAQRTIQPVEG